MLTPQAQVLTVVGLEYTLLSEPGQKALTFLTKFSPTLGQNLNLCSFRPFTTASSLRAIHHSMKYLLSINHVPGTLLDIRNKVVSK